MNKPAFIGVILFFCLWAALMFWVVVTAQGVVSERTAAVDMYIKSYNSLCSDWFAVPSIDFRTYVAVSDANLTYSDLATLFSCVCVDTRSGQPICN